MTAVPAGASQSEVARAYGVSKGWVSKLVARYRRDGDAAFEPLTRRPKTSPTAINSTIIDSIIEVRRQLVAQGLDAGPDTIAWHLEQEAIEADGLPIRLSTACVWPNRGNIRAHGRGQRNECEKHPVLP